MLKKRTVHNKTLKIMLIRHGKPDIWLLPIAQKRISINEMGVFINQYDLAGVEKDFTIIEKINPSLQKINLAFTSEMKRAKDTFQISCLKANAIPNSIFNEAGLPLIRIPFFKLKPKTWMALLRTLWFLGLNKNCETKKQIKQRATLASEMLLKEANINNCIALFGHGVFNYFLKKKLIGKGGVLQYKWDYNYCACNEIEISINKTPNN